MKTFFKCFVCLFDVCITRTDFMEYGLIEPDFDDLSFTNYTIYFCVKPMTSLKLSICVLTSLRTVSDP